MKTVTDFPDQRAIEAEACAWVSQLDGDQALSAEDAVALREWINRSRLHRTELERLSNLWGDVNILTELAIPLARQPEQSAKGVYGRFFAPMAASRRLTGMAAILVVGIAIFGLAMQSRYGEEVDLIYGTEVGEQQLVALPDGSSAKLNTNTLLEVNYDREWRKIRLLRGEAYFDVASNLDRPFVVYAGTDLVRAVGTAFTVQLTDTSIEVTVTEGRVELAPVTNTAAKRGTNSIEKTESVAQVAVLEAGQSATFNGEIGSILSLEKEELARKLSWREGMLVFSGESLEYVVEQLSRYTPTVIEISDPELQDLRIGGYFKVGETEALFEVLESNFGVEVNRISNNVVRLSSANQ